MSVQEKVRALRAAEARLSETGERYSAALLALKDAEKELNIVREEHEQAEKALIDEVCHPQPD